MAEDGQLARIASRPVSAAPDLADLIDPIALEKRLQEARARRAEALAHRSEGGPAATAPAPHRSPRHDPPPAFLKQPGAEPPPPRRVNAAVPVLIFLAGLGLGGAVVALLALQALPARLAPQPAAAIVPADAIPPALATSPAAPATASAAPGHEIPPPTEAALTLPDPASLSEPASEAAPPETPPPPIIEAALPTPPATETPPAEPATAPTTTLPPRIIIHYPSSAAEIAAEARAELEAAGAARVETIPVRFAIGRSNIRYYHDGDRQSATALAAAIAPVLDGEAPEARDFTDYATPAGPGKVELWLAGNPAAAAARTAPATPRPTASSFQMPAVIAPPETQAEAVERILIERLRQQGR